LNKANFRDHSLSIKLKKAEDLLGFHGTYVKAAGLHQEVLEALAVDVSFMENRIEGVWEGLASLSTLLKDLKNSLKIRVSSGLIHKHRLKLNHLWVARKEWWPLFYLIVYYLKRKSATIHPANFLTFNLIDIWENNTELPWLVLALLIEVECKKVFLNTLAIPTLYLICDIRYHCLNYLFSVPSGTHRGTKAALMI